MARTVTPLTDSKCDAARPRDKDYKLFDGSGLFLLVKANGSKVWRFKFKRPDGREGLATFGSYPATGLKAARGKRAEALELLAKDTDPIEHERKKRNEASQSSCNTFKAVALEWHASMAGKWSKGHAARVMNESEADLFPLLGHRPIAELKTNDLLAALKLVEKRGALDLAGRLRQRVVGIMRTGVQRNMIDYNPALDLLGGTATPKTKHRPALPLDRLPELLERIEADTGRPLTRLAVQLTLQIFIRSSELRFARWDEIDFGRSMWIIPGERKPIEGVKNSHRGAKMGTPHMVPLSRQALATLDAIKPLTGRFDLVFAGDHCHWKPLSENTVNKSLRRMGYDTKADICGHGFRTMACSALVESGLWSRDAVERQMSHQERNGVRAAYIHKAEHLDERRLMMGWWADYLDANREGHVTPYEFAHRGINAPNIVELRA
ncbi:tyrosine-type recombinase/integrase [Stutzerimonas kunmingensis]|uniref:tyrosine-type recombinase/integrase n=1 Tax=Stutzerimonas kunmingensis TaxID=1211807 RepID=UPI0028A9ABB9|nr:integrase arm-type DNA-binding domain-containing protein [Stutzerimonas kunmingensis]